MWLPQGEEALAFLQTHLKNPNLVKHCIATAAILRALARRFGEDEALWGTTGLFHDLDLDLVGQDMTRHARVTVDLLREKGFPEEGLQAILAHNGDVLGVEPRSRFEIALLAAETTTGMIVATALVQPGRRLADVAVPSILKRMKEKRFAAGVDRSKIQLCERLGMTLEEFLGLSLAAMQGVADRMGL